MLNLTDFRRILGAAADGIADEKLQQHLDLFYKMADIKLDWLERTKHVPSEFFTDEYWDDHYMNYKLDEY